jgi:hypothetical protein
MKESANNTPASVLARLKNISVKENLDFNFLLLRYMQERFLARLAGTKYVKNFVLKGGFLLLAYNVEKARPTRDIDFLGVNVSNKKKDLERIIRTIAALKINDGVEFIVDSVRSEEITEEAEYAGVRIHVTAKIGTAKNTIQLDFGFGDATIPKPLFMEYPVLLSKTRAKILAYSKETIIAEKFEAIVKLTTFNSRMKDFFDIVFLANEFDFEGSVLQSALSHTFKQRNTDLNLALDILDSDFSDQPNFRMLWDAFRRRTKLVTDASFTKVFVDIRKFLETVVRAELENKKLTLTWNRKTKMWI